MTEAETKVEVPNEETPTIQETITEECTEVTEEIITETEEDTVECIDEGEPKQRNPKLLPIGDGFGFLLFI